MSHRFAAQSIERRAPRMFMFRSVDIGVVIATSRFSRAVTF
jgi:hypothetical protein